MGEIRFVGTDETRGYPYLVCKKNIAYFSCSLAPSDNGWTHGAPHRGHGCVPLGGRRYEYGNTTKPAPSSQANNQLY